MIVSWDRLEEFGMPGVLGPMSVFLFWFAGVGPEVCTVS